jgi:peptidoglycan/LPS O-acetylase OafA/YrhL
MEPAKNIAEPPKVRLGSAAAADDGYLPFVDGLRAVAVLAVIVFHMWPRALRGGFLGVDVFFVVSGFVVSASLARHAGERPAALVAGFVARRCRRILPALMACLAFTMVTAQLFIPSAWMSRSHEAVAGAAVWGLSNFALIDSSNAYYEPLTEFNPAAHTWSLGVEEQFYLLFPWLFLTAVAGGKVSRRRALVTFGGLAAVSVAWAWAMRGVPASYYLPQTRLWELALGVLAQELAPRTLSERWKRVAPLVIGAGLTLVVLGLALGRPAHAPWPDAVFAAFGTAVLLASLRAMPSARMASALGSQAFTAIGRASYSLYLWHWPVFVLFRWTVGLAQPLPQAAALLLTMALAVSSYRYVELPTRNLRRLKTRPWATIACAIALMLGMHSARELLYGRSGALSLSVAADRETWFAEPRTDSCDHTTEVATDEVRIAPGPCTVLRDARRIFVHGDSHGKMLVPALERIAARTGRAVHLDATGCALRLGASLAPECEATLQRHRARILADAQPGDTLLLPALRLNRLSDVTGRADAVPIDREAGVRVALSWLRPLYDQGLEIAFIAPSPLFKSPSFRCSDWFNRSNPDCAGGLSIDRSAMEAMRAPVLEAFRAVQATYPKIRVWDPLPSLCPFPVCTVFLGGKPLFHDGDHLSGFGNEVVVDDLQAFLLKSGSEAP